MKKHTLVLVILLIAALAAVNRWYVLPAIDQYNEDVQAYHKRSLLPE